jgi:signal transduction histidine kinase
MRQVSADLETAHPHSGAGALTTMSLRRVAPFFVFAFLCFLVAPYVGLSSRDVDPRIAEIWPVGGVGFVLLTVIWYAGGRVIAATVAVMGLVYLGTAVAMGFAPAVALWLALTGIAQPLLMIWSYRRRLRHTGWAPECSQDVAALLFAAAGSSLLLGLVGGFPFLTPDDLSPEVLLWWVLRNTVFCFVGGATFMVIFYGRRFTALPTSSWTNRVSLVATAVACVYGVYYDPSLPLSWLLLVPSVWGGLTLTVRGTAYLILMVSLTAAGMAYLPNVHFGYDGLLPAASLVDLLIIVSAAFAFLLSLMREQRGSLIAELDRKGAESEGQRQLLSTVYNSMNDGVLILDRTGITMYNTAARQLLGRPILTGKPRSWSEAFGLSTPEGGPLDEAVLLDSLFPADASTVSDPIEVRVGQEAAARILELTAQPLGTSDNGSTMVLLHDVTAQRARLRELSNFAGMVAHDLRGPLTVLDGWLEVAQEGNDRVGELAVEDALSRARDASQRMRQVIEDWLNYTVVQNGQPRPAPVKLASIAAEVVRSRRACWAGGDEPRFILDLVHSVQADPGLLRQLLENLVENAIKYTPADRAPWVRVTSTRDSEPGWVTVEVTDHGIGVPKGQEEQIFEEFHRGPAEGRSAGTGLGLALTRRITASHGGQLTARRNPEGGSTFTFTLPEA